MSNNDKILVETNIMNREEVIKIFSKRHSVRQFEDKKVSEEDLSTILEVGHLAPRGMNRHAQHFYCFRKGEEKRAKLDSFLFSKLNRDPFYNADVIVLVFVDSTSVAPVEDGSACIENMLLAASLLDLGGCWIHCPSTIFNDEKNKPFLKEIDIKDDMHASDGIALGYKVER